jgi:ankyrin repeat protein
MNASSGGHTEVVELLLSSGCLVSAINEVVSTLL